MIWIWMLYYVGLFSQKIVFLWNSKKLKLIFFLLRIEYFPFVYHVLTLLSHQWNMTCLHQLKTTIFFISLSLFPMKKQRGKEANFFQWKRRKSHYIGSKSFPYPTNSILCQQIEKKFFQPPDRFWVAFISEWHEINSF